MSKLISVDFKVYGKVQGVFFRKHTNAKAVQLGIVGWVRNEPDKTVVGVVQGPDSKVDEMKIWLKTKGSPKSRIDKCNFTKLRDISKLEFTEFSIKK